MPVRNIGSDILRVVAILSVIIVHMPGVDQPLRDSVLRWFPNGNAVFAFLAGWFMIGLVKATDDMSTFRAWLRKRCDRLLVPYLVWSIIHLSLTFGLSVVQRNFVCPSMLDWYHYVFCGHSATQLWFIASLFYAQMTLAILVVNSKNVLLLAVIGFVSIYGSFMLMPLDSSFRNHFFILGFTSLGLATHLLWHNIALLRRMSHPVISGLVIALGIAVLIYARYHSVGMFWPFLVLVWCATFGAIGSFVRIDSFPLGSMVMGIYLTHWLVLRVIFKPLMPYLISAFGGLASIFISSILSFLICVVLTYFLRKQKWLVG